MTLNATRKFSVSIATSPVGEPGERRGERDQRPHQPERGTHADEHARALEPSHAP